MHELVFETETTRTKALSFHPTKPVLLSTHHTGHIHAHDLFLHTTIHTFHHHTGPVRALAVHPTTDFFATGGDDTDIVLWSFLRKSKIHVFHGHTDYIRSLDFHPTHPWLVSTSDDQLIKIWNIQSMQLVSTIPGHVHYVMCARFFQSLLISCSLDQTIRVWDISKLNQKSGMKGSGLLSVPNVFVKQIIDAHDKGVNWIYVHPTNNQFVSCADDRQVKVWECADSVCERESVYCHQNNVTGCGFLGDKVVSVGEDGIVNFYRKRSEKVVFDTRFWCVAVSKDQSLFAVGHDSGLKVYWAKSPKYIFGWNRFVLYYLLGDKVMENDLGSEIVLCKLKKRVVGIKVDNTWNEKSLVLIQYNKGFEVYHNKVMVCKGTGKGFIIGKSVYSHDQDLVKKVYSISKNKNNNDSSKNISLDIDCEIYVIDDYRVVLVTNTTVEILNLKDGKTEQKLKIGGVFNVVPSKNYIALISKKFITIVNSKLNFKGSVKEMIDISGGFFLYDDINNFGFCYSTSKHIKYVFNDNQNDERNIVSNTILSNGIFRSMEKNVCVLFRKDEYIFYITKDGLENVKIDFTEYEFKIAIATNQTKEIEKIVKEAKVPGQGPLNYLIKKGRGDIILPYIKQMNNNDKNNDICVDILIGMNKLEEAYIEINSCKGNKTRKYQDLLNAALEKSNVEIAEKCLWKLGDFQGLFLLFVSTKQKNKIEMMKKVGDDAFKMNIGVFLGDKKIVENVLIRNRIVVGNDLSIDDDDKHGCMESSDDIFKEEMVSSKLTNDEENNDVLRKERSYSGIVDTKVNNEVSIKELDNDEMVNSKFTYNKTINDEEMVSSKHTNDDKSKQELDNEIFDTKLVSDDEFDNDEMVSDKLTYYKTNNEEESDDDFKEEFSSEEIDKGNKDEISTEMSRVKEKHDQKDFIKYDLVKEGEENIQLDDSSKNKDSSATSNDMYSETNNVNDKNTCHDDSWENNSDEDDAKSIKKGPNKNKEEISNQSIENSNYNSEDRSKISKNKDIKIRSNSKMFYDISEDKNNVNISEDDQKSSDENGTKVFKDNISMGEDDHKSSDEFETKVSKDKHKIYKYGHESSEELENKVTENNASLGKHGQISSEELENKVSKDSTSMSNHGQESSKEFEDEISKNNISIGNKKDKYLYHNPDKDSKLLDNIEKINNISESSSETNNIEIFDKNLLESKNEYIIASINNNSKYKEAMENVTGGKFSSAITILKEILYSMAANIENNNDKELRRKIGTYISGLITEKKKKKIENNEKSIKMTKYFASLDLEINHKKLAKTNLMMMCFKNENYNTAKLIAHELKNEAEGSLLKLVNKIEKSTKSGDKIDLNENGVFCFDVSEMCEVWKECRYCFVKSNNGNICQCCEIGFLE